MYFPELISHFTYFVLYVWIQEEFGDLAKFTFGEKVRGFAEDPRVKEWLGPGLSNIDLIYLIADTESSKMSA